MDSIKPNGWIQLIRERDGKQEIILQQKNTVGTIFLGNLIGAMISPTYGDWVNSGRYYTDILQGFRIDGMGIGSFNLSGIGTSTPTIWATWAGTFVFGSNLNFRGYQEDNMYPIATYYGTFNFAGSAYVNFLTIGVGSQVLNGYLNNLPMPGHLCYKHLSGSNVGTFVNNDILRVTWVFSLTL